MLYVYKLTLRWMDTRREFICYFFFKETMCVTYFCFPADRSLPLPERSNLNDKSLLPRGGISFLLEQSPINKGDEALVGTTFYRLYHQSIHIFLITLFSLPSATAVPDRISNTLFIPPNITSQSKSSVNKDMELQSRTKFRLRIH